MEIKKILLDTDIGADCDDAGALAVLHNLVNRGKAEILAITHCTTEVGGAVTIKAINEWYGRENIPVGVNKGKAFLEGAQYKKFTGEIMKDYLSKNPMPDFPDAIKVMRKSLADNRDVTMVALGPLNNIAALLKSEPDELSPLTGYELVKQSVKGMYVMGGNFEDLSHAEYNILCDIDSARYVADNFPVPIVYCGFEIGSSMYTGERLKIAEADNPIKKIYALYIGDTLRESWDPITVYAAVENANPYMRKSSPMKLSYSEYGKVLFDKCGKDHYLIRNDSFSGIREELEDLIN